MPDVDSGDGKGEAGKERYTKKRELARKESGSARDGRDAHCPWFSPRQVFQLGVLVNSAGFDATLPTSALPVLSHLS